MNNRGASGMGLTIFAVFIGILFAFAIIPNIFGTQAAITTPQTIVNGSLTQPAQNAEVDLGVCQQGNTSAIKVWNASNGVEYPAANYSVSTGIGSNGYESARINFTGTVAGKYYTGSNSSVDCTYEAFGYNDDAGSRGIASMWGIFVAIAVFAFVIGGIKFDLFDF